MKWTVTVEGGNTFNIEADDFAAAVAAATKFKVAGFTVTGVKLTPVRTKKV